MTKVKEPTAVVYHREEERVYWGEKGGRIRRAFLNGSSSEVIFDSRIVSHPTSLAIDYAGDNIYWADRLSDRISVAKTNGAFYKVLITTVSPESLALDVAKGYKY